MVEPSTVLAPLAAKNGLLSLVYKDLAQPGVCQVGKAIGAILGLGNTVLIPLRLLNEAGRKAEERAFARMAERMSQIPESEIEPVRPEIGLPLLDGLSSTEDPTLQDLYLELLARAATQGDASMVHPSFVTIIRSLTPDEGKLLNFFGNSLTYPFLTIEYKRKDGDGRRIFEDYVIGPVDGLTSPESVPLYVSNLIGLGIFTVERDRQLVDHYYDKIVEEVNNREDVVDVLSLDGVDYERDLDKGILRITRYGERLISACVPTSRLALAN